MDVFQAIRDRRSIRGLSIENGEVKNDDLMQILDAARLAPSDCNGQPWHFVAIRDRNLIKSIAERVNQRIDDHIARADPQGAKNWENYRRFFNHYGNAPVLVAVLYKPTTVDGYPVHFSMQGVYSPNLQSVGAAVEHMNLAAVALGYATCWMTGPVDTCREELETMLNGPAGFILACLVAIGVPAKAASPRPRKKLEEVVTFIG